MFIIEDFVSHFYFTHGLMSKIYSFYSWVNHYYRRVILNNVQRMSEKRVTF